MEAQPGTYSDVFLFVKTHGEERGAGFEVQIDHCGGRGCGSTTCTGGYTKFILPLDNCELSIRVHEQSQHHVTALHSSRITFHFETTEQNIDPKLKMIGMPTGQRSIYGPGDQFMMDQIMDRTVRGTADFDILVIAHRNNRTGLATCYIKDESGMFSDDSVAISPLLQQIRSDRINASVQPSQARERSGSLEERRSKRCKKRAARRR
ncbi:hypothetical protein MMC18_000563 [Xylographa bjoerkii]|nr:hypothetical protein [Xylographa bjoerkii]